MVDTVSENIERLRRNLKPLIEDLDEKLGELKGKKEKLESVSRFLAYVNGDVNLVGIYADQNLILESLEKLGSSKDEYKASCYLLRSDDASVKMLPQYQDANDYISRLINYFKMNKSELSAEITDLERVCQEKKTEKKYYDLFEENNPLIEDIGEFEDFLQKHTITSDDRIDLLVYTIKSNLNNYQRGKN